MKHNICYLTWSIKVSRLLFQSIRNNLGIKESQLYIPIMSLFFYIHNTPLSHKRIDFKRNHYIKEVVDSQLVKDYNSNIMLHAKTKCMNSEEYTPLFGKVIPLLDPIHFLLNNYNHIPHIAIEFDNYF